MLLLLVTNYYFYLRIKWPALRRDQLKTGELPIFDLMMRLLEVTQKMEKV